MAAAPRKKWDGPKRRRTTKHFSRCGVLVYRDRLEKHEEACEGPPECPPEEEVEEKMLTQDADAQTSSASLSPVPSTAAPGTPAAFQMTDGQRRQTSKDGAF